MPTIYDNIDQRLLDAVQAALDRAVRADLCTGYFNLRGWKDLAEQVEHLPGGSGRCCRLLIGMPLDPDGELRRALVMTSDASEADEPIDNRARAHAREDLARRLRQQLALRYPTHVDGSTLRRLRDQLIAKKVFVRLAIKPLHAKLYLCFFDNPVHPAVGYVGSSNLTLAGLARQGELNVDVADGDACQKLARWFEDRWGEAVDVTRELIDAIETSWASERLPQPYHVFLKMAWVLSAEARRGGQEFTIPHDLQDELMPFQAAAVHLAACRVNRRGGVLLGDVVGLGKTRMAAVLARIFDEDAGLRTLIVCPKRLESMWKGYVERYRLRATVTPLSLVPQALPGEPHGLVIVDESHNLRNSEGRRHAALREWIQAHEAKVVLLSATPYNKTYLDLSAQLRLFLGDDTDVGVAPTRLFREVGGEAAFSSRFQVGPRTLGAFERSTHVQDWRDLMRQYLVRRTRSFIRREHALDDEQGRPYLPLQGGGRAYFPVRVPRTVAFDVNDGDPDDTYARLLTETVVETIGRLRLPRYGLANYLLPLIQPIPTPDELRITARLSRAGRQLTGFCRTGLFKRLESNGWAFLASVERHVLRNQVFLHALEKRLAVPIGAQDAALLDPFTSDVDDLSGDDEGMPGDAREVRQLEQLKERAQDVYQVYALELSHRFAWLPDRLFERDRLMEDLRADNCALLGILTQVGTWDARRDRKLAALERLVSMEHANEKVLVFTQFADTARYLVKHLTSRGVGCVEGATGDSADPTDLAHRFSPVSNECRELVPRDREIRVLIATDVLSEGQNLQDGRIVVNFDLPWAIIRLVQRAGRVDRLGQQASEILCCSFLPASGVERIINLHRRVGDRLRENAELVGTDEVFFEEESRRRVRDLYHERAGVLDDDEDSEVETDLVTRAAYVWERAVAEDPSLSDRIPALADGVASARSTFDGERAGVLALLRSGGEGSEVLALLAPTGELLSDDQAALFEIARCGPETAPAQLSPVHHDAVSAALTRPTEAPGTTSGQLGPASGVRRRVYERLRDHARTLATGQAAELAPVLEALYDRPLRDTARQRLGRQLEARIANTDLAEMTARMLRDDALCQPGRTSAVPASVVCSLGLVAPGGSS